MIGERIMGEKLITLQIIVSDELYEELFIYAKERNSTIEETLEDFFCERFKNYFQV